MIAFQVRKDWFFDRQSIIDLMDKKERTALRTAGGRVRLTARRSVKRSDKPSDPGQPPHTRRGFLRNDILFGFDPSTRSVVVGPHRTTWLGPIHEFGGTEDRPKRLLSDSPLAIGDFAPIRDTGFGKVVRTRIRSDKQLRLATHVREEANKKRQRSRRYPARPFMKPALQKIAPSLPGLWARSGNS